MISFIVPTLCRPSIKRTLDSIKTWPGDEIICVSDASLNLHNQGFVLERPEIKCLHCPPGNDWGHTERNFATPFAKGKYLAHIDDDDWYAPDARELMADAILKTPNVPVLFRMRYPNGITLWNTPELYCGNVGTPMILIPNAPERLGQFRPFVGGDCAYLEEAKWERSKFVWREEITVLLGHNT